MTEEFTDIIKKLISDKGIEILDNAQQCKGLLLDYSKNEFKEEIDFLSKILEAGSVKYINSAENLEECGEYLIKNLEDKHYLSPKKTAEMLNLLFFVLKGKRISFKISENQHEKELILQKEINLLKSQKDSLEKKAAKDAVYEKFGGVLIIIVIIYVIYITYQNNTKTQLIDNLNTQNEQLIIQRNYIIAERNILKNTNIYLKKLDSLKNIERKINKK